MSKFVIECPNCGRYAEARNGFFARKKIDCACGHTINVRTDKLTSRVCAHCGNNVVFDQSKYNGPIISDHSSKNYREHGKIQQESEKETTP